jgi:hypothetical protein
MKTAFLLTTIVFLQMMLTNNYAQNTSIQDIEPAEKLEEFTRQAAHQKLYLHFNKSKYFAGEEMWFNAYLLNAVTHLPDTEPTNIYVDLINSSGVLMGKRILLSENGVVEGDINLPLTLPDGNYYVRAYTNWMKNFGEDYYFTRNFYIANNKYDEIIPRSEVRSNRRFNRDIERMASEYNVLFFPEGGELVNGVVNRVAFKAMNILGHGMDAEGVVTDQSGNEIVEFSAVHNGMGSFELEPQSGSVYTARVSVNGNRPQMIDLPAGQNAGVALRVSKEYGNILIDLSAGKSGGAQGYTGDVVVVAHTRGEIIFSESLVLSEGVANVSIPEHRFPAGIAHITVFSENSLPIAERLTFIDREDSFSFSPRVVRTEHEGQQYYGLQLDVFDVDGNPVEGHFSMSVLGGGFDSPGSSSNILSHLLLSSDLRGVIEDPQHYFDPEKDLYEELDLVMMTHGWRRFDWPSVLAGDSPDLTYERTSTLSVTGKLSDRARDEPVNNHFIQMKVLSGHNDTFTSRSNNRGVFIFDGLTYPDNFKIELSSNRLSGDYPPDIEIIGNDIRGYTYTPNIHTNELQVTSRGRNWRRVPEAGRSPFEATREHGARAQQYGIPDQTIYIDREKVTQRSVLDVLVERAQGLQVSGNRLMFRGPTSINLSSDPMFMLDGVQTSQDVVLRMNPREVERIEIFRGTSASMFGVRGSGGVIIAYQRQAGNQGMQDVKEYLMIGYHSPREFYPDILPGGIGSTPGEQPARTILWQPNLTTDADGTHTVYFPAQNIKDSMKIVIEGVGTKGGIGFGEFTLELR